MPVGETAKGSSWSGELRGSADVVVVAGDTAAWSVSGPRADPAEHCSAHASAEIWLPSAEESSCG